MMYSHWNSVAEYLVKNLEDKIRNSGKYKVGDQFLTESAICEEYGVGRSSVREVLRILSATGYITSVRGKGTFIASTSGTSNMLQLRELYSANPQKLDKLIEVRLFIEPPAIYRVAEIITSDQLESISRICNEFNAAVDNHDVINVIALDEKFHSAIVDVVGNEYLSFFNMEIQKKMSEFRAKTYMIDAFFPLSKTGHNDLFHAIKTHNPSQAEKEIRAHIQQIRTYYTEPET